MMMMMKQSFIIIIILPEGIAERRCAVSRREVWIYDPALRHYVTTFRMSRR